MIPGLTYAVNTLNATEAEDPVPACSSGFRGGVWYIFQPSVGGPVAINTCGSTFNTALSVYTGSCNSLTPVACNEDDGPICAGNRASLNFDAHAGIRYYILAGGNNNEAGELRITVGVVDLASTRLLTPNVIIGGRPFAGSLSVSNLGLNAINASWVDRLSLSNSSLNIVLQDLPGPHNAPAGGSYDDSFEIAPPPLLDGVYTLTAHVDLGNRVAETQEANNTISVSVTISNIRPAVLLLSPSNFYQTTTCVPIMVRLAAKANAGSYKVAKVEFFDNGILVASDATAPYNLASAMLSHGTHAITAQAVDIIGIRSPPSEVAMVTVNWPDLHQLATSRNTNHEIVCCMGVAHDQNYLIEAATEMSDQAVWQPYLTNRIMESNLLIFTNHAPLRPHLYFRARLLQSMEFRR